jgi:hypothetical protein
VNFLFQCVANTAFDGKGSFTNHRVLPSEYQEYETSTDDFYIMYSMGQSPGKANSN